MRSAGLLARITVGLLGVQSLVRLAAVAMLYGQTRLVQPAFAGQEFDQAAWASAIQWGSLVDRTAQVSYVATGIFFLWWMHRAYRNLQALGAQGLKNSPGWAVGGWFIPFFNLWKPFDVMREIWKASDAEGDLADPYAWDDMPSSPLLGWWWGFWLTQAFFLYMLTSNTPRLETWETYISFMRRLMGAELYSVVAAVLAILVVLRVTARQEARWERVQMTVPPMTDTF